VQFEINIAIRAQLSTLPKSDQMRFERELGRLAENPQSPSPGKKRVSADRDLWELRISPKLHALVRIKRDKITVLAVVQKAELERYLRRKWTD
jgi:mRNA-degrading endonuclease RelE of RelBE toxin-antitoxin system